MQRKLVPGFLYFYIHFVVEVACFFVLSSVYSNLLSWIVPFIFDAFAFVPQSLIGSLSDRFPKIPLGIIGVSLLFLGVLLFCLEISSIFVSIIILCLGNACLHVSGAEVTLRSSDGKLSPSAIFVAGGSFGVITGKLLAGVAPFWFILALILSAIPFILLAENYRKETWSLKNPCKNFNYQNKKLPAGVLIFLVVFVVIIRGYMGYGIPTSWNKTVFENILLYCSMGVGKALGGILSDKIGLRKTAIISVVGSLPFLLFGDNLMIISLIGVALFSMTMSITLALLVSALQKTPGLAFGLTTIGLFLGTIPIFFFKFGNTFSSCLFITISTILCLIILLKTIQKDQKHAEL